MNAATLERLMLDRALGALDDDASELLDAFLAERPAERKLAAVALEVTDLARAALADNDASQLPPLSIESLRHSAGYGKLRARMGLAASLAACVLIGIGIRTVFTSERATLLEGRPGFVMNEPPGRSAHEPQAFWSANRILKRRPARTQPTAPRWNWESPQNYLKS
jgi:hypothetical protein